MILSEAIVMMITQIFWKLDIGSEMVVEDRDGYLKTAKRLRNTLLKN